MKKFISNNIDKILLFVLLTCGIEAVLTLLYEPTVLNNLSLTELFSYAFKGNMLAVRWLLSVLLGFIAVFALNNDKSLNIAMRVAGNGQYGTSRWATAAERAATYPRYTYAKADKPGYVISFNKKTFEVDISDNNVFILAPPGSLKTKGINIPGLKYNALVNRNTNGGGASILAVDCKGEELEETYGELTSCGYRVAVLDFTDPLSSGTNNLMHHINKHMDVYKNSADENERIRARARAEHYAQILSSDICGATGAKSTSESSEFFSTTAQGLITSMILLVSEHGAEGERHIISVFNLIIELNGLIEGSNNDIVQQGRLKELISLLPENIRIKMFAGAAIGADVRTSMNIFSSALSKLLGFVNVELEQMICNHSPDFDIDKFIEEPTAIFLVIPDEDDTKNLFASIFVRQYLTALVEAARNFPDQRLPREVLVFWDEFGQAPHIRGLDTFVTALRSRGVRLFLTLQSFSQLDSHYDKNEAKTIKDTMQMLAFTHTGPMATETSQELTRALGKFTTQGGSVSTGDKRKTQSQSLMGRELMTPSEIQSIPQGQYIILKSGAKPIKANVDVWWSSFDLIKKERPLPKRSMSQIKTLSEATLKQKYQKTAPRPIDNMIGAFDTPRCEEDPEILWVDSPSPTKRTGKSGLKKRK